jgi:1,2-phenylacetyl-CoA epoxidase catalytic subunit
MLKDLGKDPVPVEHDRSAAEYASVAALDEEMPDWAALVAAMVLADGAITSMLRSFSVGSFESARSRVPKMLAEEEFHSSLGAAWYRRLAETEGEARDLLLTATNAMLPGLIAWVGADDASARLMVEAGVLGSPESRLADFGGAVRGLVALLGIDFDAVPADSEWDETRGRTAGQPAEEAVERARGDRNRALFVE